MARTKGGGDRGGLIVPGCVPDATFKSEIDALITAGTQVTGKLVSLTWSNDYEVTSPAGAAIFDGKIIDYEKTSSSYRLTVRLVSYIDQNSTRHTTVGILNVAYDGTTALQDSVIIDGSTYVNVEDGGTGGWGAVIALDVPASGRCDVIF